MLLAPSDFISIHVQVETNDWEHPGSQKEEPRHHRFLVVVLPFFSSSFFQCKTLSNGCKLCKRGLWLRKFPRSFLYLTTEPAFPPFFVSCIFLLLPPPPSSSLCYHWREESSCLERPRWANECACVRLWRACARPVCVGSRARSALSSSSPQLSSNSHTFILIAQQSEMLYWAKGKRTLGGGSFSSLRL